jgi:hypothetical protein
MTDNLPSNTIRYTRLRLETYDNGAVTISRVTDHGSGHGDRLMGPKVTLANVTRGRDLDVDDAVAFICNAIAVHGPSILAQRGVLYEIDKYDEVNR